MERLFAHPTPSMASGAVPALKRFPEPCDGTELFVMSSSRSADLKTLRTRWHPDRFLSKFSQRLSPAERAEILAQVTQVAAALNAQSMRNPNASPAVIAACC